MSRISMHFGGRSCVIELLDEEAPETIRGISSLLPLQTMLAHAKFAGEEVMFMVPRLFRRENIVGSVSPGDVAYYPDRQTVCIFYGGIVPFAQVGLIGRVTEGLPTLREAAPSLWRSGPCPAEVKLEGT